MIRIFKTGLSSSSDSPEGLTAELGQQTSPGRRGFGPKSSGHRSPGGGASILANKRLTLPFLAFVAVLAAGLLFLLPGGLLQAQSGEQFFSYAENGTGPVATFTSTDPEGATPGYWMLTDEGVTDAVEDADIADRALFNIDQSGVLSFKEPRSYEDDSNTAPLKEYRVTVQVSDGSKIEYFKAYITVTDVEETGKVTWTVAPSGSPNANDIRLQQFQPGAVLTPTVTDPDGATTVTAWKWYRGSTAISGAAGTGDTYTVVSADVGNHIRVEATYSDGRGPAEMVSSTSENPVQEFRRSNDNMVPAFSPTDVTRRVEENSKGNVGGPVTATDGNGDKLTYTISGDDAMFDHDNDGGTPDINRFTIDMATGQLMAAVKLNYEGDDDSYDVMVTATDSSGNVTVPPSTHAPATVTINVIDVDEKPTFDAGSTAAGVVMAQTEGRTAIDLDNDTVTDSADVATFVASDPEGKKVTLTLMGNDAGSFELADDADTGNAVRQVLSFKEKTDFEMPGDRNRDNVYEVTVRASDGTMNADRALIIKVINDATEGGKVTLSPEDAVVGVELTATLAHMEGGVAASGQIANERWQWQKSPELTGNAVCDGNTQYNPISDATKAIYTPVSDDAGSCLRAMVTYNYQFETGPTMASSDGTEVLVNPANQAPKFKEGTRTFRVVMENVEASTTDDPATETDLPTDNVGSAIEATDANGDDPTYSLGGGWCVSLQGQV